MNKIDLYHKIPYGLKVTAASLWGLYLNWWRYGTDTEKLVTEFIDRDTWTFENLQKYQNEKLSMVLHHAATKIPYYQDQWNFRRRKGDKASWDLLENWPILKKEDVRKQAKSFIDPNGRCYYLEHTSGTTGTPLTLYQNRKTLHYWYAAYEARIRRWNGFTLHDRWAILGGQLVASIHRPNPPFWVWNQTSNQLYLSAYHINKMNTPAYMNALEKHKVKYLVGYPSSISALAEFALESNHQINSIQTVISNAEPLFEYQRNLISKAFNCEVVNSYGLSELVCAASECAYGLMHVWPEIGFIEIFDDDTDDLLPNQATGRIVSTGLINLAMPLIRYETGDRGALVKKHCSCQRNFLTLEKIEGRCDDVIITPDGRKIGRLDPVYKADIPIREAQIVQEKINEITLRFVPSSGYDHNQQLIERLENHIGKNMKITLEPVNSIPRSSNGKFRAVISKVKK